MFVTGPSSRAKAASPKAPPSLGNTGGVSLSTGETLTPESCLGGRPSRASVVDTAVSPELDTVSPNSRLVGPTSPQAGGSPTFNSVNLENSASTVTLAAMADSGAKNSHAPSNVSYGPSRGTRHSGELRRRKYAAQGSAAITRQNTSSAIVTGTVVNSQEGQPPRARTPVQEVQAHSGHATVTAGSCCPETDEGEVLIEGPLQQRHLLLFWRWRWCVLDRRELRVYANEQASLLMPEKPLERRSVAAFTVGPDMNFPSVLVCTDTRTGEPLSFLRAGPGLRWEEVASSTLWLGAFAAAGRAASRQRGSSRGTAREVSEGHAPR